MNEVIAAAETVTAVINPQGDLVTERLPLLRSQLKERVASGVKNLTMDLAGTRMVDSAGIGLLVATHNSLAKVGGALAVVNASPDILQLFRTMRIHQHFSVSGS